MQKDKVSYYKGVGVMMGRLWWGDACSIVVEGVTGFRVQETCSRHPADSPMAILGVLREGLVFPGAFLPS